MFKTFSRLLPLTGFVLLIACSEPAPHPGVVGYGPPPPQNYPELIQKDFSQEINANDINGSNYSDYVMGQPMQGRTEAHDNIPGVETDRGWLVCGTLFSRKVLSGYSQNSGTVPFFALLRDGKVSERLVGEPISPGDVSVINDSIHKTCATQG